uniref:Uncharacterized protein n=1 Tax=Panagrellus redivivus TaxID=6233 RepID=A0A7E4UUJ6_PANRE
MFITDLNRSDTKHSKGIAFQPGLMTSQCPARLAFFGEQKKNPAQTSLPRTKEHLNPPHMWTATWKYAN